MPGCSAAGKTQLAMQLALCAQLPRNLGGVSGAACFLSTSWVLPTNRLVEMIEHHPLLSPALCGLADIHFMKTPTIPLLLHVLSQTLPEFQDSLHFQPHAKPVKLLIIDAITELFHSGEQVSTSTLVERSKNLNEIATLLHTLANKHGLAIVVLNEVLDAMDRPLPLNARPHEVRYSDQARLFSRADTIPGERLKEAALGLVWANQVNVRVMLTRTERVRTLDDTEYRPTKRRRLDDELIDDPSSLAFPTTESTRIRRLSVIFNSTALPSSLDYIVTQGGILALEDSEGPPPTLPFLSSPIKPPDLPPPTALAEVCPLDLPFADLEGPSSDLPSSLPSSAHPPQTDLTTEESEAQPLSEALDAENGPQDDDDEWEAYWKDTDLGSDVYSQVNLDAFSSSSLAR